MNEYGLHDIESEEQLALRGVEVATRITGLLVETRLTQKYKNDTENNLELAYTFPLPVGATLLSFSVRLGCVVIKEPLSLAQKLRLNTKKPSPCIQRMMAMTLLRLQYLLCPIISPSEGKHAFVMSSFETRFSHGRL